MAIEKISAIPYAIGTNCIPTPNHIITRIDAKRTTEVTTMQVVNLFEYLEFRLAAVKESGLAQPGPTTTTTEI